MTPHIELQSAPERKEQALDGTFTLQGVSILLGIVIAVLTIVGALRKTRRENEADAQARTDRLMTEVTKHNDSFEGRLKTAEVTIRDFMPRAEIEAKIEHLKGNRQQAEEALKTGVDRNARDIVEMKVALGRLEQKQDGFAADMGEIKALLKEQARDTAGRLDKMQECLSLLNRKMT